MTHHAPLPPRPRPAAPTADDLVDAAYGSDLTALLSPAPDDGRGALRPAEVWIHGHTHESFDAIVGGTRVVSNAKGYGPLPPQFRNWDNPDFDPFFVVNV